MNQQAPPANQPSIPPPANQPVVSAQAPPPQPPQVSTPIMEPPANQQQLPQMAYAESGQPGGNYFQPNFNHGQNMADLKSAPRNEDDEQETNQQYSVLGTSNALKDDEEPRRTRAMAQPAPAQAGVSKFCDS